MVHTLVKKKKNIVRKNVETQWTSMKIGWKKKFK